MEPDDDSEAPETRFSQQVHVGDVAPMVRQEFGRISSARYGWRTDRPPVGNSAEQSGRYRLRSIHRTQREDQSAQDSPSARGPVRMAHSPVEQCDRAQPGPYL